MPKGAEIVLRCLRAEGADLVFGYPGGAIMPLYDALDGSGVRHILTRHEQGAVFAAEGYARSTGKVGVAIATSGPGATNLVTGIADAKMDSVPLVCITGQVRTPLIGTDAFQETDVFGLTLSLTKWSRLVRSIEEIPEVATVHGLGAVPPECPYYLGMVGMHGTRAANMALNETDLLLVFGARLDDRVTGEPTRFAPHARIIHFEIDPAQLDRVRACEVPVIGDLSETIPEFWNELRHVSLPDWSGWRAVATGEERAEPDSRGVAEPTLRFLDDLFRH